MGNQFLNPNYTFLFKFKVPPAVLLNMIGVACNSRIPQAICSICNFQFATFSIYETFMADFIDKVTSRELFNITIKRITCVTLFGMVTGFPFVPVLKVICLRVLLAKSQKVLDTACKIEKIRENKNVLHVGI
jgi:hypothetical protein